MTRLTRRSRVQPPGSVGDSHDLEARLTIAVAEFGAAVREPLAAKLGNPENQIGPAVAVLVKAIGKALGLKVVTHAETPLSELSIRPDYAVHVAGGAVGFIEVKRPGKGADPTAWSARSHDGRQWQKLSLLPNVLYTDGHEWALYRDGERAGPIARLAGTLTRRGDPQARRRQLAWVLRSFYGTRLRRAICGAW